MNNPEIICCDVVDSTNSFLKQLIRKNPQRGQRGLVVTADSQTAGRGRLPGRGWSSPPGKGLLCSIAIPSGDYPRSGEQPLPLVIGVILARTVEALCAVQRTPFKVDLKWPNDLYVHGKKLSGILIEVEGDFSIVGFGMNLNTSEIDFPPELRGKATSLKILTGHDWDRSQVLREILKRMDQTLRQWSKEPSSVWNSLLNEYRRRDFLKGKQISLLVGGRSDQVPVTAVVQGIADDGALAVQYADGRLENIYSGEIAL